MSIECKCDVTALCSDMASDALKTTGVAKEQNTAKGNAHRVQSDQREASQSEETDCEEGSRKHPEGVKGPEPPHHARRPMNAFLIFCKRHRGVVRDRFPHLENRSVTKILGEWWANLEAQEKASYTELAKQYKEAFLQANPDFKWYKLPAPPLRTLVTRPSNQTRPLKLECDTACGGPITPGKLADETQMGSLSSLLASLPPPPGPAPLTPPPIPAATGPPKPPKKRYLQELGAGEVQHTLPMPPVYRLRMAASEETDRNTESRSPFRLLRPSPAAPQKGGVLSEGTTLKTSKQDIIDRVVDRMCRLSDGEAAGSKLSDNNNDAQYPCSRERSLVGDVDSRCCTGGQSQKSLLHSSGSPGPPVERNDAHEVAWDTDDGKVGAVVPSAFEDFVAREKEPFTVQEDSEDSANFPVAPGRKFSDEIKDFTLSDRDGELSTFSSSYEPGTASTTADCLNLKKTKASSKEFQKESCETVGDRITTPNTLIGEYAGSSTRESSVGEESDTSVEKTAYGIKTKVSKDLSSSLDTNRGSFSVPPRDMGAECLQQSTGNEEQQRVPSSPGRSPTGFECPPEERFLLTDKFVRRDCVTQLSRSQDTSNSSVGTENGDNLGPIHAVGCIEKDRDSVALSTAAAECLPGAKTKWKRVCSFPKVKKLHHSESTEKVQSASDLLKCVDSPTVPIVSSEEQGRELTVSHGKEDCSRESTDDFSDSKLEENISSDDVCRRPDVEEMMKVQAKKTVQKHVQVKPSVRTVESATQFDGGTRDHVFVSESLKKKRNKVKNVCSTALLKYRHVVHDTEGKDGGKTEGLATVICSTNDSGIFPPVRSVECKGESATNCTGEVKVKIANKIPPSNIQNQSPVKKPAKLRGVSKKREHICLSSGSEMVKIHPEKDFKRMKLDKKIVQDVQTKNVPEAESASKGFAEDSGLLLPYDVLEERDVGMCDRKRVTGSKMPAECLDLNVYSIVQNNNCQETRIYDSENFKGEVGTIHSASANKDNLCQEEKNLHKAPVHSVSSKSNSDVEDNGTIETCASRVPSVPEAARTFNELAETMRTEENSNNSDSVFRTDNVELVNICASKDNIFKDESDKMCDQSTLDSSSKLVRTSVPVESYQGSSISVVEESAIGELTASSSSVVLDIDLDLTQTRLSPQGLADLAAKDGVVVLTLPADDELVLPSLLPEPQLPVVAVQPAAVECLEAASQTHTEAELQDAGGSSIVGNGVLPTIDKDTSSIESEDSRESMSKETAAPSTKVTEVVSPDVSDSGLDSAAGKPREDLSVDGCSSRAAAQMPMPLEGAGECLPVMNACADSSVSIQKSEESCDGESSGARRKSTRTCKGLRYHQFMVEGRLKKGHRRPLSRGSSEKGVKALRSSSCALAPHSTGVLMPSVPVTSPSDGTCALPSVAFPPVSSSNSRSGSRDVSSGSDRSDAEMDMPLEMRNLFSTSDNLQRVYTTKSKIEKHLKDALEDSMLDSPAKKRFRAADFNLEEKIEALPSLSLEEFQMKKKARKRKAAPPLPPLDSRPPPKQTVPSPAVSPDSTEGNNAGNRVTLTVEATAVVTSSDGGRVCSTAQLQSAGAVGSTSAVGGAADVSRQLVGSQKRKARKQSITRLDSDNVHILRDTAVVEPAVLSNIALSSLAAIAVTGNKLVK